MRSALQLTAICIALSAAASIVSAFVLPADVRVVHHSSGATWSKTEAIVLFPACSAAIGMVVLAAMRIAKVTSPVLVLVSQANIVGLQIAALIQAAR